MSENNSGCTSVSPASGTPFHGRALDVSPGYKFFAENLREAFEENIRVLGGNVIDLHKAIEMAQASAGDAPRVWVDPNAVAVLGLETNVDNIWEAEIGFAVAKAAIAQTGTLIFESGPNSHRLSTLVTPVNVVFLTESSILPTMAEGLELVANSDRTCVFVTGPSRTADIEGVLVRGVHGPGELYVAILPA